MCVYSMVMDHAFDKWKDRTYIPITIKPKFPFPDTDGRGGTPLEISEPAITDQEIRDLRDLLRRAKEYDKKNNQPDCELEEKKQKLRDLAKELGVDLKGVLDE